jgi:hypothetical protein
MAAAKQHIPIVKKRMFPITCSILFVPVLWILSPFDRPSEQTSSAKCTNRNDNHWRIDAGKKTNTSLESKGRGG